MKYLSFGVMIAALALVLVVAGTHESERAQAARIWTRASVQTPSDYSYDLRYTVTKDDQLKVTSQAEVRFNIPAKYVFRHEHTIILDQDYRYADGTVDWDREIYSDAARDAAWTREVGGEWRNAHAVETADLHSLQSRLSHFAFGRFVNGATVSKVVFEGRGVFQLDFEDDTGTYRWVIDHLTYRVVYSYRQYLPGDGRQMWVWEYRFRADGDQVPVPADLP